MNPLKPLTLIAMLGSLTMGLLLSPALAEENRCVEFSQVNWGNQVGFRPDLALGEVKKGEVINKSNWEKAKTLLPETITKLLKDYALEINVADYEPLFPSSGYVEATKKYCGQPKLKELGSAYREQGISNYTAGLPFPKPKNGQEIAYNFHYSYNGDDATNEYGVYWISAKSGVEKWEEWSWNYIFRVQYRTDLAPIPAIEELKKKDIIYTSMTSANYPYSKKGLTAIYNRFATPQDQEGYVYIPTMRRTLRASFGTRGEAWNSTDLLFEDVRGFMGYPEWMNWKLIEQKTMLFPQHAGIVTGKDTISKSFGDFKEWPHWNVKANWERRPVYVVEATPKFTDYPYSKMRFYFDAETGLILYKETYDKKGDLWKLILIAWNSPAKPGQPSQFGTCICIDLQAEHASVFPWYKQEYNIGLDYKDFSLSALKKKAK